MADGRIARCHGGRLDGEEFRVTEDGSPPLVVRFHRSATMNQRPVSLDLVYLAIVLDNRDVDLEFAGWEVVGQV